MAFLNIESAARGRQSFKEWLHRALAGLKAGFEAYAERQGRFDEISRLQALSDEELARIGVSRDRIVHHVFRDKMGF